MHPIGVLVGTLLGLLLVMSFTLLPPILVLCSRRLKGHSRAPWLLAVVVPAFMYWSGLLKGSPFGLVLGCIALGPVIWVFFWRSRRVSDELAPSNEV